MKNFLNCSTKSVEVEANQNKNNLQLLQQIEIFRTFLRGKQVGEKHGRFQFVIEIAHKVIVLISISRHGFANKKLPDLTNPPF